MFQGIAALGSRCRGSVRQTELVVLCTAAATVCNGYVRLHGTFVTDKSRYFPADAGSQTDYIY